MSEGSILNGVPVSRPPTPRRKKVHLVGRLIVGLARKAPIAFGLVVSVIVAAVCWTVVWEADTRTETCTVTRSQQVGTNYSKTGQETSSQDRVTTKECGTLNVDDDALRLRFGSGSDFASIQPGVRYRMTIVGWAGAVFSTLPNVVGIQGTS